MKKSQNIMKVIVQYEKWSVLSIFGGCGSIPQNFGSVLEQIILYFIKIVRVSFIIACPVVFIVLYNCDRQRGVLKLIGNAQILVVLALRILFSKFLGRSRSGLY